MILRFYFILFFIVNINSQTINMNEMNVEDNLRDMQLLSKFDNNLSFTIRPITIEGISSEFLSPKLFNGIKFKDLINKKNIKLKILPIDLKFTFNSHHPYNRNNGSMIPNKGFQQLLSLGIYAKLGFLSIQFKPEYIYAENLDYEGFPNTHYEVIWAERYHSWNMIDIPERFGNKAYSFFNSGQSSIRLNYKNISLGLSSENIWWGPSRRNGIMMSNHARGFKHITFNTIKPINTFIGSFEWQVVTGKLYGSGFTPPNPNYEYASTKLYVPKNDDWRYFQGLVFTYNPKLISGLSLGFIRWVQMYGDFAKNNNDYFPVFENLFRKNDKYANFDGSLEMSRDQAAGIFFRWIWKDSKAEIYGEFHHNDSKVNFRDLLLDSDHSRAVTIGTNKIFDYSNYYLKFGWEWTQLEQTNSKKLRNAGSWYHHHKVRHGFTNHGEVIGAGIGPGSNSHFLSVQLNKDNYKAMVALEIIDNDNDWFYKAFGDAFDFRRYWKDYNFHLNFQKRFNKTLSSFNLIYSRNLNYQWELEDFALPYYHPGRDIDNFSLSIDIIYNF